MTEQTSDNFGPRQHTQGAGPTIGRYIHKDSIRTTDEALVYLTDCNLATVVDMAGKKSRSKHEYSRQIAMAQTGVTWCRTMNRISAGRVADVIRSGLTVGQWARQFEVQK